MSDIDYMKRALQLAESVKGQTSPNPPVGSIVVKNNEIIGFGAHLKAGEPHAEVHALNMAGSSARGATIYVTLEPCSHTGETPPCVELIIFSGIKRAVIATRDIHDVVSGRGIKCLEDAGIDVVVGIMEEEARIINEEFFHYIKLKRPFVTLKTATSLDGKTATSTGDSKWITGKRARIDVHENRNKQDAILVGVETIRIDNPHLTTRLENGGRNPIRILLDSELRTPLDANVIIDGKAPTWIFTGNTVEESSIKIFDSFEHVKVFKQEDAKQVNLEKMLAQLGNERIMTLYVEGGSTINEAFIKKNLIDKLIMYIAPKIIGGKTSPTAIGGEGFQSMSDVLNLNIKSTTYIGEDIKIVATVNKTESNELNM